MKTTSEMIEDLRGKGLHDIMFRNAGVGLLFYEGPPGPLTLHDDSWRTYLVVRRFYLTLDGAVLAEWRRRFEPDATQESASKWSPRVNDVVRLTKPYGRFVITRGKNGYEPWPLQGVEGTITQQWPACERDGRQIPEMFRVEFGDHSDVVTVAECFELVRAGVPS